MKCKAYGGFCEKDAKIFFLAMPHPDRISSLIESKIDILKFPVPIAFCHECKENIVDESTQWIYTIMTPEEEAVFLVQCT